MNKHIQYNTTLPLLAVALIFGLIGCSKQKDGSTGGSEKNAKIESVMLNAEPSGAVSIIEARKITTAGTNVTVIGRIAGVMEPFSKNYATLVIADNTLETCDFKDDDHCSTPWDACCVAAETINATRLSVQIVGDDGIPVPQTLKGANKLKELDEIVVTGVVAQGSTAQNLILNATGIYLKKPH